MISVDLSRIFNQTLSTLIAFTTLGNNHNEMENFIVHLLQCNEYRPTIHGVNQLEFLQFREYHWKNTEKDNLSGDCLTFSSIFSVCLLRMHIYVSLSRLSTCIFLCSLLISFHHFPWLSFRSMLTYKDQVETFISLEKLQTMPRILFI